LFNKLISPYEKYNFNPGPSILPEFTIKNTAEAVLNLNGSGLSIMRFHIGAKILKPF